MDKRVVATEEEIIADLRSPDADVRRKAAEDLGNLASGDDREVRALIEVMQNDCEFMVREMAYWALSSPVNQAILSQHPDWQVCVIPPTSRKRKRPEWWEALLTKLQIL